MAAEHRFKYLYFRHGRDAEGDYAIQVFDNEKNLIAHGSSTRSWQEAGEDAASQATSAWRDFATETGMEEEQYWAGYGWMVDEVNGFVAKIEG